MSGYSGVAQVKNPDVTERYVRVADILRRGTNWDRALPGDDDVAKLAQELMSRLDFVEQMGADTKFDDLPV